MGRVTLVALLATLLPARAEAWGFEAHRFLAERTVALLPPDLRPFFETHRAAFVERSIDPDSWREAGFAAEESPNHFFHADWAGYGSEPRRGILREREAAIARWGRRQVERNGTLPWRVEEMYGRLVEAFRDYRRRGDFGRYDILFFSAWLGHYVTDAHVPFHAVEDYDGEDTGQEGVHARFETFLFERYRGRLPAALRARVTAPVRSGRAARDAVFEAVLEGATLVGPVLAADRRARAGRDDYDQVYWDAFFAAGGDVLGRRLGEAAALATAVVVGAWEEAGRPPLGARASGRGR